MSPAVEKNSETTKTRPKYVVSSELPFASRGSFSGEPEPSGQEPHREAALSSLPGPTAPSGVWKPERRSSFPLQGSA